MKKRLHSVLKWPNVPMAGLDLHGEKHRLAADRRMDDRVPSQAAPSVLASKAGHGPSTPGRKPEQQGFDDIDPPDTNDDQPF